jgi:cell fate (sporulation/competence/biofilm development) regulator YmcA (YheA/YmcA/DUF963 family)
MASNLIVVDEEFVDEGKRAYDNAVKVESGLADLISKLDQITFGGIKEGNAKENLQRFISEIKMLQGEFETLGEYSKEQIIKFIDKVAQMDNLLG